MEVRQSHGTGARGQRGMKGEAVNTGLHATESAQHHAQVGRRAPQLARARLPEPHARQGGLEWVKFFQRRRRGRPVVAQPRGDKGIAGRAAPQRDTFLDTAVDFAGERMIDFGELIVAAGVVREIPEFEGE